MLEENSNGQYIKVPEEYFSILGDGKERDEFVIFYDNSISISPLPKLNIN